MAGCITSPSQKDDQVPPKSYQNNSVSAVPTDILTVTPTVIKTTDESKKSAQKSQEKVKDISATDLEEAAKYVKKGLMLHQGTKYYNADGSLTSSTARITENKTLYAS